MKNKIVHFTDSNGINYKFDIGNYPNDIRFIFDNNHYTGWDNTSQIETIWVLQKINNSTVKWCKRSWWILPSEEAMNFLDDLIKRYNANKCFL